MGDIYVLRVGDEEKGGKVSKVDGYTFSTEQLFSNKEAMDNNVDSFNKIASIVYGRPLICEDEFQYMMVQSMVTH
jgi:hypothetical protein